MRLYAATRLALLLAVVLSPAAGYSDDPTGPVDELSVARAVIAAAQYATLITIGTEGYPQARIMDPFPPEDDWVVWMATNGSTRKVEQIRADSRATLSYFDREGIGYATLTGRAELIVAPADRSHRFKSSWSEFYDDGPHGDDYVLIRFVPHRLELMSIEHGVAADPKGWAPAIIDLPRER